MVQHQIRHQQEFRPDPLDIRPVAQNRVHRAVVRHGKPVVRGVGKERQDMHPVDHTGQFAVQEVPQQVERLVLTVHDGIAVGDDQRVPFRPLAVARHPAPAAVRGPFGPEGLFDADRKGNGVLTRIDLSDQGQQAGAEGGVDLLHGASEVSLSFQIGGPGTRAQTPLPGAFRRIAAKPGDTHPRPARAATTRTGAAQRRRAGTRTTPAGYAGHALCRRYSGSGTGGPARQPPCADGASGAPAIGWKGDGG